MESIRSPDPLMGVAQSLDKVSLNDADCDIIKKPRTNFTNNVLRRAIPNMNIQDKIGSISMNKLNVLSAMRLGGTAGSVNGFDSKKIKTVNNLPKVQSLDSRMMDDILPKTTQKKSSGNHIRDVQNNQKNIKTLASAKGLDGIEEGKAGDEDVEEDSAEDDVGFRKIKSKVSKGSSSDDGSSDDGSSDSGDSSIDMDGDDDEEKLYEAILTD